MRPEHPQVAQPRAIAGERRVAEFAFQHRVVQAVEFQREEDQVAADRRHPFVYRLVEAADRRIGGIAGEQQLRIGRDPAQHLLDLLILRDRSRKFRSGQTSQFPGAA